MSQQTSPAHGVPHPPQTHQHQHQHQHQLPRSQQQQQQQPRLTEVNVNGSENVALNLMVSFLGLAQRRGAFSLDEASKIFECIKVFQRDAPVSQKAHNVVLPSVKEEVVEDEDEVSNAGDNV